ANQVAQSVVTGRTGERALYALRVRIFAHLQRLSLSYYEREMAGRIMTRMTSDVEALSQLLQSGLVTAVASLLTCAGIAVALVVLEPRLGLATLSIAAPLLAATLGFRRSARPAPAGSSDRGAIRSAARPRGGAG